MKRPLEPPSINKILFVDDDPAANYLSKELLLSMNVLKKLNRWKLSQSPWTSKKSNCADVILLDIKMPGIDGFDFLEKIKKPQP